MLTRQQLVGSLDKTNGVGNPGFTLTIHETANKSRGANAQAHANLQSKGNVRTASWHWTVDEKEAIQSFNSTVKCWHAGTTQGNNTSESIEICVNSDGDFVQAVRNAAELAAMRLKARGHGVGALRKHKDWTGKNCPTQLLAGTYGITWDEFVELVQQHLSNTPVEPPVAPTNNDQGVVEMKLWHVVTPWGEDRYGYTTVEAGAGTFDANVFQHLSHTWPYVELPWDVWLTEIEQAWKRALGDDERVAAKVVELIDAPDKQA